MQRLAPNLSANRSECSRQTQTGKGGVPRCSTRGSGPCADESQGCRLGCGARATNAIAGGDSIVIHRDGTSQRYCATTINGGEGIQRDAVLRYNTSVKRSAGPQRRRTANLPENFVMGPRIDDEHR